MILVFSFSVFIKFDPNPSFIIIYIFTLLHNHTTTIVLRKAPIYDTPIIILNTVQNAIIIITHTYAIEQTINNIRNRYYPPTLTVPNKQPINNLVTMTIYITTHFLFNVIRIKETINS